jgi:magnesium-transporting ATPase (P-type)
MVLLDDSFAAVPQVLSEGRRVVANIERVANLFVTKTVYAAILAVVVAVGGFPFPFFPRHLTIVSTLTIGIPGFFLALARGAPRASPGFVAKVLAFTIPAGVIAATATLAVYALARLGPNMSGTQQRTAAMLELAAVAFAVLVLVARPLNAPRIALVVSMTLGLVTLVVLAGSRSIFDLQLPGLQVVLGATAIGAVAIVLLVASQRWAGAWVRGHR